MHPNIHSSSSYNGRDIGTPKCLSTNEWIKNMWGIYMCVYTHTHTHTHIYTHTYICDEILLSHKRGRLFM